MKYPSNNYDKWAQFYYSCPWSITTENSIRCRAVLGTGVDACDVNNCAPFLFALNAHEIIENGID